MVSHPSLPFLFLPQHHKSSWTSTCGPANSSVLLILSTSSRIFSDYPFLPPTLASMSPHPSHISPVNRPMVSQLPARRGRLVLLCLPVRTTQSAGLFPSCVPFVTSSLPLEPPSSDPIKLFLLVNYSVGNIMEPETYIIHIDSFTLDVQPLPSPTIASATCVVVNDLPFSPALHD